MGREHLADSQIVGIGWGGPKIDVALRLRVWHARRFNTELVACFGWHWWSSIRRRNVHECVRIVEVSDLSVALVVEGAELYKITVRSIPVVISGLFTRHSGIFTMEGDSLFSNW